MATLVLVAFAAVAFAAPGSEDSVRSNYRADLASEVDRQVDAKTPEWLAFYRELHASPELSLHEEKSAARIAKRLSADGYIVTSGVGGHGVVGILRNGPGPTVLIRGDTDGLPVTEETGLPYASKVKVVGTSGQPVGVMHACGHDVHQTCLVASAHILAETRGRWSGTVMIIAQPAEEVGKGARMMIEDGLFERFVKPDYCLALHVSASLPAGTVGHTSGWALANVDSVDITIYGRGGHGSRPHQTIDPVVTAAHVIVALQTIVSRRLDPLAPGVISVGSVHAGSKHNIISDDAKLELTVRSYTDESRKLLLDGIRDVTVNICRAMGCTRDPDIVLREDEHTPSTYNHPKLAAAAVEVFNRVIGPDNVIVAPQVMGGEDFGRYSKYLDVPGFMFWLGSVESRRHQASQKPGGEPLPSLHSGKYAPDPEPTIRTGVRCMTTLALSLLDERK